MLQDDVLQDDDAAARSPWPHLPDGGALAASPSPAWACDRSAIDVAGSTGCPGRSTWHRTTSLAVLASPPPCSSLVIIN